MKIEKVLKWMGILIASVGTLVGVIMLLINLEWIIDSKDFIVILQYVFIMVKYIIIGLLIYAFGEVLKFLYKIKEMLEDKNTND